VRAGHGADSFPLTAWPGHTRRAVRLGDYKLVVGSHRQELYNLAADPGERQDRAALEPEIVARLTGNLQKLEAQVVRPSRVAADPETLRMLREGGYLDDEPPTKAVRSASAP